MADLYPDVDCTACRKSHAFCYDNGQRRPPGATYEYTCPATRQAVRFTPPAVCLVVDATPPGAVPIQWISDQTMEKAAVAGEATTRGHAPTDTAARF
jgi:hypothetical protein